MQLCASRMTPLNRSSMAAPSHTKMRQAVTSVSCGEEFRASTECTVSNNHWTCVGNYRHSGPLTLMLRRLEDRIRELCRRAVLLTEDSAELHEILEELRASVREHTQRLRYSAVNPPLPPEKRAG